jgi:ribulose 1,5-bisphosphate synthetase/thiazole synthase
MCIRKPAHKLLDELEVAYDDEGTFVVVKVGRLTTAGPTTWPAAGAVALLVCVYAACVPPQNVAGQALPPLWSTAGQ